MDRRKAYGGSRLRLPVVIFQFCGKQLLVEITDERFEACREAFVVMKVIERPWTKLKVVSRL